MNLTADQRAGLEQIARSNSSTTTVAGQTRYTVMFDDKGKLLLPETPEHHDQVGLCSWLTAVFNLDTQHPIAGGVREGLRGPDGHVVLRRIEAPPIRFEPAARINNPTRLIETLS